MTIPTNDNPYSPPAADEPAVPRRVPNYLVAFGASSLIAEVLSEWWGLRWEFIMGGFVVGYLLILLLIGVFSAPVRPFADDEPPAHSAGQ